MSIAKHYEKWATYFVLNKEPPQQAGWSPDTNQLLEALSQEFVPMVEALNRIFYEPVTRRQARSVPFRMIVIADEATGSFIRDVCIGRYTPADINRCGCHLARGMEACAEINMEGLGYHFDYPSTKAEKFEGQHKGRVAQDLYRCFVRNVRDLTYADFKNRIAEASKSVAPYRPEQNPKGALANVRGLDA